MFKTFLKKNITYPTLKAYITKISKILFIEAFTGMAQGLFATLIVGTILKQIGLLLNNTYFGKVLIILGNLASILMGAGIGVGIASQLKMPRLIILSSIVVGFIGAYSTQFLTLDISNVTILLKKGAPGNPISSYVVVLLCIFVSKFISGKTKLDIIIVPTFMFISAIIGTYIAIPAIKLIEYISIGIKEATNTNPVAMGIFISVVMGILLTLPTSSAAIWITIAAGNESDIMLIAGGAAVVGCSSHMIGFAVMTYKENGFSGLVAQGLGTSMLQIPNVVKHPIIMLPPIISSMIVGPLATSVFKLKCNAIGGGMGTSGLVGVFGTISSMPKDDILNLVFSILFLMFIMPSIISYTVCSFLKNKGIIKSEYLKLNYLS